MSVSKIELFCNNSNGIEWQMILKNIFMKFSPTFSPTDYTDNVKLYYNVTRNKSLRREQRDKTTVRRQGLPTASVLLQPSLTRHNS